MDDEVIKTMETIWAEQGGAALNSFEKTLLCSAFKGEACVFEGVVFENSNAKPHTIRGSFLRFLLTVENENYKIHGKGLRVKGAQILCDIDPKTEEKHFDLSSQTLSIGLTFENCSFDGAVIMSKASLKGVEFLECVMESLKLDGAKLDGDFECLGSQFLSTQHALFCNRTSFLGKVNLGSNSQYKGQVSFVDSDIEGDFSAQGASFEGNPALTLRGAKIKGIFHWRDIKTCENALILSNMSCKAINMDEKSWFLCEKVNISNLTYEGFAPMPDHANGEFWCRWLDHQPDSHLKQQFRPKPFEMLIQVLTNMGMVEEATAVKIHKEKAKTNFMAEYEPKPNGWVEGFSRKIRTFGRRWIYGALIAYGYRPSRAAYYLVAIGILGGFIYWWAALAGIMTPSHPLIFKEAHAQNGLIPKRCAENWVYFPADIADACSSSVPSEYSEFQPLMYSFDILLPIINLRQEADWAPRVVHHDGSNWLAGRLIRIWEWFEIAAGWLLSLLLVSAIGGIIRK